MDKKRKQILRELEKKLNYRFRDIFLLETALTHSSYINENPQAGLSDNERMEFLGDAVLGAVISDLLLKKYANFSEGMLSKTRAAAVNEKPLAQLARKLDIGRILLLGHGEEISGGKTKDSLLANALEAVIAAIYLDSGYNRTKIILEKILDPLPEEDDITTQYLDCKTELQEFCQQRLKTIPVYSLTETSGPDHAKIFTVQLKIADIILETGSGRSKKEAEKQAAQKALEKLLAGQTQ
ncbi:MAG TPA: ribonuclease III [Smithellaceae bacterium]|nr:ribonuclease III [Smithellaceae bacterium]